jgi:peroxiredoxin
MMAIAGPVLATEPSETAPDKAPAAAETPALPYLTLMIARDPAVQAELGLTRRQAEQLSAAVAEVDQPFWLLRDVPLEKCRDKLDELLSQLRRGVDAALTDVQRERLDQIVLQARGFNGLVSPEMAVRLRLSDDQLSRLRALASANLKASHQETDARPKLEARQLVEVLSPDQADQWAGRFGKPFDLGGVRRIGCDAPELRSVDQWINGEPLTLKSQRGSVVALHFWAFGCVNCQRNLPHYQAWYDTFPKTALTIIGVHTPETEAERSVDNLRASVEERAIRYPVAVDAAAENWKAWGNNLWPSVYLIDKQGHVRYCGTAS